MTSSFIGKRALVTGGGSGLGRATALLIAELGAKVFALSNVQAHLDSLKEENPKIESLCVDLLDCKKSKEIVQKITPVHMLVNCAGVGARTPFVDVSTEEFDSVFGVNVKAAVIVSQVIAKDLITRHEKGRIVNVCSVAGHRGFPCSSTYSATKGALNSYTKSMAVELSPKGIRVNAVSPTLMVTPMSEEVMMQDGRFESWVVSRTPQGKIALVEDSVNAIIYLLSDQSDMVNGHNLVVDGGFLCS